MGLTDQLATLDNRLQQVEARFADLGYTTKNLVVSEMKKRWRFLPQAETYFGMYLALCIDTFDPWKQNKVRFFSPFFNHPDTKVNQLDWAWPISSMGGFDDCGLNWVPPAGSMLCIMFDRGYRESAYYIGTTWSRNRGPDGEHNFDYTIPEYNELHEGNRKGYLVGKNDGSQVLPPWNTENYNGLDINSFEEFEDDPDHQRIMTYPHIYGFKTPQKHMFKMVDGNYKCQQRWKRMEVLSSCGNWMLFKDDHLHPGGQWAHPSCGCGGGDVGDCEDGDGNPKEKPEKCPTEGVDTDSKCANKYYKHENECRPYKGPGTPQNNKCDLDQAGIQFLSTSGHTIVMDDSVEEPSGKPEWERSTRSFDFGCTDKYEGKSYWKSATGHLIEMNDFEEDDQIRGEDNYIRLQSAAGNLIEMNDHSITKDLAGEKRGITMRSTSNHSIEMIDNENDQEPPVRKDGGVPTPKAKKAFVRIRTGYGLEIALNDYQPPDTPGDQEETVNQNLQIFCPQKDNEERGPHIMRFQEVPDGPGYVWLNVGGDYLATTYDNHVTVVGRKDDNPSNKVTSVSRHTVIDTEEYYINVAEVHAFIADKIILLMAGKDCKPPPGGTECGPCVWPVLCLSPKGMTISDRVYVSASPDAPCIDLYHLLLAASGMCPPWEKCPPL